MFYQVFLPCCIFFLSRAENAKKEWAEKSNQTESMCLCDSVTTYEQVGVEADSQWTAWKSESKQVPIWPGVWYLFPYREQGCLATALLQQSLKNACRSITSAELCRFQNFGICSEKENRLYDMYFQWSRAHNHQLWDTQDLDHWQARTLLVSFP